jgi:hypothetical protein
MKDHGDHYLTSTLIPTPHGMRWLVGWVFESEEQGFETMKAMVDILEKIDPSLKPFA